MTTEERLREAIRAHTDVVDPAGEWPHVRQQALFARRRRRVWLAGGSALAIAAAVVIAVVAVPALRDGDQAVRVGPADPGPDQTTVPDTTPTTLPAGPSPYVYVSDANAPEDAAREFASEFLGMTDPIVGEMADGKVAVRAIERGPITEVAMERIAGTWRVTNAFSDNIHVKNPSNLDEIASPLPLIGLARAFEGTVQVEVRQDGQQFGDALGTGFVTGRGDGVLGDFDDSIEFAPPSEPAGAVVFYTESAEDGSVLEATVVRVAFATSGSADLTVDVWFSSADEGFVARTRTVARTSPLRGTLTELLMGPTEDERSDGLSSMFSEDTAGMLRDVNITSDGTAIVDFDAALRDTIPNASTSAGSAALIGQLNRTIFQFESVEAIEYRLGGSCEAFWEWLQGSCHAVTRDAIDGE